MANDTLYNGWSNYETWIVNLWIDNDFGSEQWSQRATELVQEAIDDESEDIRTDAVSTLTSEIEDWFDEYVPSLDGVFSDLLTHALGMVDWREIAEAYVNDVDVFSAGWNMPGCMPNNPPELFTDCSDARMHVSSELDRAAEIEDEEVPENGVYSEKVRALEEASLAVLKGSGEYGATIAGMHYFVTRV